MGREIRRVPPNWEHPMSSKGHYVPLFDQTHAEALTEWEAERLKFEKNPEPGCSFEEWHSKLPDAEYYRPEWLEEPTHYQVYETVTEGTPTSPVFASLEGMRGWLILKGYSAKAATKFIEGGWAPSFVVVNGKTPAGIHSLDIL